MHEILKCSMIEQARLVKTGKVSARELLDAAIERIEAVNPQLNAVVLPMYDLAEKALSELKVVNLMREFLCSSKTF